MQEYNKYSDKELARIIADNGAYANKAFDTIFEKYSAKLRAFCIFKTPNEVSGDELFQDTWLKYIETVRSGKEIENTYAYLISIAKHTHYNNFRKQNAVKQVKIHYTDELEILNNLIGDDFLSDFENKEIIEIIKHILDSMKESYKEAFIMHWFGGMTYSDIGEELEISADNAKMRCHRAMQELIRIFKLYYAEEMNLTENK